MDVAAISELAKDVKDEVIGWRRHLHQNPELSFEEQETSRFVYETLEGFGGGLELTRPTTTSVVARLLADEGAPQGPTIALRADMDALPIHEETGLPFASKREGVMHACGHDGHTAILLGVAKALSQRRDELRGELRFVFQHAEETHPGGGEELVEAGVMEGVDAIIGLHMAAWLEVGKANVVPGPALPASDRFELVLEGEGGHAAWPHDAVDPVVVAGQVVSGLQHVVSRELDPRESAVVSVTKLASDSNAYNVIPDSVELAGTVRTFSEEARERVPEAMERIIGGIASAHGASYSFEYRRGYRPVVNDERIAGLIGKSAAEVLGEGCLESIRPMAGDDFSAYQQVVPGGYFFVGARNEEKGITHPHHHPCFDIDEDSLEIGVKLFVCAALAFLLNEETEDGAKG